MASAVAMVVASCGAGQAVAQTTAGPALYLEAGSSWERSAHTDTASVGLRVPTGWRWFDGSLALAVDTYLSRWHSRSDVPDRDRYWQLGVVPMLRWRFDAGRSPWFVDAGIGVSYLSHRYRTRAKAFGSRWNFSDHLGVGYIFGNAQRHELGLYVKHVSNAGLDKPNPGETFWLLRYSYRL